MFGGEDIEDIILRDKIPGRYSTWERGDNEPERAWAGDDDIHESEEEEEEPEEAAEEEANDPHLKNKAPTGPGPTTGPQTGVKGVLNHAYDQKLLEEEHRRLAEQQRQFMLYQTATGKGQIQYSVKEAGKNAGEPSRLSDDEYDDDSDDEFMREFRAKRLQELQLQATESALSKVQISNSRTDEPPNGIRHFGQLREINPIDLPDEVDNEDRSAFVIVHLHEPYIRGCAYLTKALQRLAVKYPSIKFLNLQASASNDKIDPVALPILNIYQAGEVKSCILRVCDALGQEDCSVEDVEWLLENNNVSLPPSA